MLAVAALAVLCAAIEHGMRLKARKELRKAEDFLEKMNESSNTLQMVLARFAAEIYRKPIPNYDDGGQWRPGDVVEFKSVIGGNTFRGVVVVNIAPNGKMMDRTPLKIAVIEPGKVSTDREFQVGQVSGVRLLSSPLADAEKD